MFNSKLVSFVFCLLSITLFNSQSFAKDLTHRLGVGPRSPFSFALPALGVNYHFSRELSAVGAFGLDTSTSDSKMGLMAGIRRVIFEEGHMNYFGGGSVAMVSNEVANTTRSGVELSASLGGEFFLPGLDNLAFQFEMGVQVISMSKGGSKLQTFGDTPIKAGAIFYF